LPFTVFIYYGYNARAIELVDLISVALNLLFRMAEECR